MAKSWSLRNLIFLSHWSGNAKFVRDVFARLDPARAFLDVRSFEPGKNNLEEMKKAIEEAAVFVFVISPDTPEECLAFFESARAEFEKARRRELQILVWPIKGSTYRDCPAWMQDYFVIPSDFTNSDIARQINHSVKANQESGGNLLPELYEGRENLERKILLDANSRAVANGLTISTVILTGLPGMGRATLARHLVPRLFPAMRDVIPEFELLDAADAVDIYIALLSDIEGRMPIERMGQLVGSFPSEPNKQAELIAACLKHWGEIRQTVIIKVRWSLRGAGREIQPWFASLLVELSKQPDIATIFISGRKLTPESVSNFRSTALHEVPELDAETATYIISKLVNREQFNPTLTRRLAELSMGHPDTAHHIAFLINKGRSPETLFANPSLVFSFQDRVLEDVFSSGLLSELDTDVLSILCWFPGISLSIMSKMLPAVAPTRLSEVLWELSDYCLVELSQSGSYSLPAIVRATFMRRMPLLEPSLEHRVISTLREVLDSEDLTQHQIEPIALAFSMSEGSLPDRLRRAITPGTLSSIVERHYQRGISTSDRDELTRSFTSASRLAEIAFGLRASDDTIENILFQGADAATRLGENPSKFIDVMLARGYVSALYVRASYKFHVLRDSASAIVDLKSVIETGKFHRRSIRLLTRIYLRERDPRRALETLERLYPNELKKDSGFLAMKIRALRGLRRTEEAEKLETELRSLPDEYGEIWIFEAVKALKRRDYAGATRFVELAQSRPKASPATLMFLRCLIELNQGNVTSLANACALADRMGRTDDAHQLRARAALLVERNWQRADAELKLVVHRTWFDWQLELEIVDAKLRDPNVQRDVLILKEGNERKEEIARQMASALDITE